MLAAGQTNIPDNAHEPAAGNQNTKALVPYFVELIVEGVIISDEPKLAFAVGIFLERPVGGRGQDQVD